ncbi:MAG: hypothetical protein NC038_03660 [Paludibacter sp.]|nr:hypothetical protein [Bacteroidales bacterium]MCM1069176.1 hypothetical protein [Prevotella sp.]MCM1354081.1 hypothetical protein [Bacteroides sp.]MCM1442946.1 hypothetical protein [Muribaculum sp.]MCM1481731.1 hypothetical protein [Paludibacter sp.]
MKKYFLLCTICFVALVGCEETAKKVYLPSVVNIDATAVCCDVANPVDNLPWLHDIVYDFMADSLIRKEEMAYFNILRVYVCTQMEEDNILYYVKICCSDFSWVEQLTNVTSQGNESDHQEQLQERKKMQRSQVPPQPPKELIFDCEGNYVGNELPVGYWNYLQIVVVQYGYVWKGGTVIC